MIDARELRIGNWVSELDQPKQIDLGTLFHLAQGGHAAEGFDSIPLTPDLLEKAGFKSNSRTSELTLRLGVHEFNHTTIDLTYEHQSWRLEKERWGVDLTHSVPLYGFEYLHQLQNLIFSLTGQELEITL